MAKLTKLVKVNDSFSVNRYDNGWMLEIGGADKKGDWQTTKTLCNTEAEVIDLIKEYNTIPVNT